MICTQFFFSSILFANSRKHPVVLSKNSTINKGIIYHSDVLLINYSIVNRSEGLQIEYIAIFLAVLFPGALVALNHSSLENLSPFSSLRVYCAGIWHNIVVSCCVI